MHNATQETKDVSGGFGQVCKNYVITQQQGPKNNNNHVMKKLPQGKKAESGVASDVAFRDDFWTPPYLSHLSHSDDHLVMR